MPGIGETAREYGRNRGAVSAIDTGTFAHV